MTNVQTIASFLAAHGITMSARQVDHNPSMTNDWSRTANHYRVTFRRKADGRTLNISTHFSQGSGISGPPKADSVLNCLASDARAGSNSFKAFCGDLGYHVDSRSAERTWKAYRKTSARLKAFLGAAFDELMDCESL